MGEQEVVVDAQRDLGVTVRDVVCHLVAVPIGDLLVRELLEFLPDLLIRLVPERDFALPADARRGAARGQGEQKTDDDEHYLPLVSHMSSAT